MRSIVEGARLRAALALGPLHHATAWRGPPPRSAEEQSQESFSITSSGTS
jgi:hypothetical protein